MNDKIHILLAEDDESIAKLIQFKLNRDGYDITIARDGGQAVGQFGLQPWSLIILDVMMPVLNGWEVLKALRSSSWRDVPVLVVTAKNNQLDVASAAELGATEFLRKPFDPAALSVRVKKMIEATL